MKKRLLCIFLALVMFLSLFSAAASAASMNFTDVQPGDWFYNDVRIAVETGLVNGKSATIYAPHDYLTYGEAVKLAACMHQLYSTGSVTLKNGEPWYQSFVNYCKLNNIISMDYPWTTNATRAGYMDIFSRALPDTALAAKNIVEDNTIPDVPSTHINAAAIYKLYRAGILQGVDAEHNCRPGSNINRSEVAAILTRMMNADQRISFTMKGAPKPLVILQGPESQVVSFGTYAVFSVVAEGAEPLSYQWQARSASSGDWKDLEETNVLGNMVSIIGPKTNELKYRVLVNARINNEIRCIVRDADNNEVISNTASHISEPTTIPLIFPLTITQQPQNASGKQGEVVTLKVVVSGGVAPLKYQWQSREYGTPTFQNSTAGGCVTDVLTPYVQSKIYDYRCVITDAEGNSVTSDTARVTSQDKYIHSIFIISEETKESAEAKAKTYENEGATVIRADLNSGAGGNYIYLGYRTTTDKNQAITDLFIKSTNPMIILFLYEIETEHYGLSKWKTDGYNLNRGTDGNKLYLYTTKDSGTNRHPLYDLKVYFGTNPSGDNPGWEVVKFQNSADNADLNKGAGGKYIYLLMKRKY